MSIREGGWRLAVVFIAGGGLGGLLGTRLSGRLCASRGALNVVFVTTVVAIHTLARPALA